MERLKERSLRFVTMADIERGLVSGPRNVLVCIDDGNRSVMRAYREVLAPMGIKPLLAIYPNIIGRRKYALGWDELRALAAGGCEIAAHGFFHLHVNDKLYARNRRYFMDEIHKSKRVLEEKMDDPSRRSSTPPEKRANTPSGRSARRVTCAYDQLGQLSFGRTRTVRASRYMLVRGTGRTYSRLWTENP